MVVKSMREEAVRETVLYAPLLSWIEKSKAHLNEFTLVSELHWSGRRVDLAMLSDSGTTTAYELKLFHTKRVLEQASLNAIAFDESYVVTACVPSSNNLERARELGLGVLLISLDSLALTHLLKPQARIIHDGIRRRLQSAILKRSEGIDQCSIAPFPTS